MALAASCRSCRWHRGRRPPLNRCWAGRRGSPLTRSSTACRYIPRTHRSGGRAVGRHSPPRWSRAACAAVLSRGDCGAVPRTHKSRSAACALGSRSRGCQGCLRRGRHGADGQLQRKGPGRSMCTLSSNACDDGEGVHSSEGEGGCGGWSSRCDTELQAVRDISQCFPCPGCSLCAAVPNHPLVPARLGWRGPAVCGLAWGGGVVRPVPAGD